MIFPMGRTGRAIYACLGVMLFSMYLVYDTQLIAGFRGNGMENKHKLGADDYVLGALILYLDIINIFIYLLELFGGRR